MNDLRTLVSIQNPVIQYEGKLSQEIILDILNDLERKMDRFGEKLKVTRKAFNIITESLQNIVRYSAENGEKGTQPIFILDNQADKYVIATGNLIHNNEIAELRYKIEQINQLDWYGVQQAYKDRIRANMKNKENKKDKNSAGLGLIEIARKSEQKFVYNFKAFNQNYSYFLMLVSIYKSA